MTVGGARGERRGDARLRDAVTDDAVERGCERAPSGGVVVTIEDHAREKKRFSEW